MTRKRFVKLMMAKGYSRNEAQRIARGGKTSRPYMERYVLICLTTAMPDTFVHLKKRLEEAMVQISDAAKVAADNLAKTVQAINVSTPAIIENMRRLQEAAEGKPSE